MTTMEEFQTRLDCLIPLAERLERNDQAPSTTINRDDPMVRQAEEGGAPIPEPLTLGTLLASTLGTIESVKIAIKDLERTMVPGGPAH